MKTNKRTSFYAIRTYMRSLGEIYFLKVEHKIWGEVNAYLLSVKRSGFITPLTQISREPDKTKQIIVCRYWTTDHARPWLPREEKHELNLVSDYFQ